MRRSGVKSRLSEEQSIGLSGYQDIRISGYRFVAAVLVVLQLFCSGLWARPRTADEAEKVVSGWLR